MIWLLVSFCLLQPSPTQAPSRDSKPPAATAVIRGRITHRESGEPIPGARIAIRTGRVFEFDARRQGEYLVAAVDAGAAPALPKPEFFDRLSKVAERVVLGEGERRTIELRVVKIPEER